MVYIELSITGLGSYLGAGKDRVVVRAGLELDSYEGGGGDIIWRNVKYIQSIYVYREQHSLHDKEGRGGGGLH